MGGGFFIMEITDQLTEHHRERFRRQITIPEVGETGQIRLLQSRVLIVGLGGLGSPALYYLSACGIGEIGIVDSDRVEISNLHRQILHGEEDVGKEKTVSARESIMRLRPDIRLILYPFRITAANAPEIINRYDFVIEATDNFESKFLINDVCVELGKPFSHAGISGMYGQAMTVVPGKSPCFRCVFDEVPASGTVKTTAETGVLGTVPGVFGIIQATEAIKYLTSCGSLLTGRLLTWDALSMTFREIKLPPDKRCSVCRKV
jgi:molybdopterin/thiamine biosynthesis adenylyltransferase